MGVKNRSFTLIEMIIVVGVLGFVLPILFAVIFLIIRQQGRIYALQTVKREGDFVFNSIKSTIKQHGKMVINPTIDLSPYPTYNPCPVHPANTPTPAAFIFLFDKSMTDFSYRLIGTHIASGSAGNEITPTVNPLNSDSVEISDLKFSCYRTNQFSPPVVSVSFTVTKSGGDPDAPTMDYASRFQLKSY